MLNKQIAKDKLNKLKLLILDSDGVSLPRGTFITEKENEEGLYTAYIKTHCITDNLAEMIKQLKKKMKICFSSGRSLIYLQNMYGKVLGEGTIIQAENGNLSLIDGKIIQHFEYNENYFRKIALIKEEIKKLPIKGFEPKQFILTVHTDKEIPEVYQIVKKYDPEGELKIMWNGEAFDIQKKIVSKGEGLRRLMGFLEIKPEETIAVGDRLNDKEMIETAGIGVSADPNKLEAEYWVSGDRLAGEVLLEYLIKNTLS